MWNLCLIYFVVMVQGRMPSLSHIFEKVHIHMACCGGTMTIREHAADTTDGGEEKRLGKWHAFKTLLRSWFGGRIWGGRQTGARGPEARHCAGEDAPVKMRRWLKSQLT